jgi:lysophospholipase L1-like esterase
MKIFVLLNRRIDWLRMAIAGLAAIVLPASGNTFARQPVRIACVGTSITEGISLDSVLRYPTKLQTRLGAGYIVRNFGRTGSQVLRAGSMPYCTTSTFRSLFTFAPNWIIIEQGTNDSPSSAWGTLNGPTAFPRDLEWLIDTMKTMSSVQKVWLCTPPPAFSNYHDVNEEIIKDQIAPCIRLIAGERHYGLVELHDQLLLFPEAFTGDGVHPNADGAELISLAVFEAIQAQARVVNGLALQRASAHARPGIRVLWLRPAEGCACGSLRRIFDLRGKRILAGSVFTAVHAGAMIVSP